MKNKLAGNLQLGFGISLIVLILISSASFFSIQNLISSSNWVNHTNIVIKELEKVISVMKDAESGQRGFLLTNDTEYLESYNGAKAEVSSTIDTIRKLTIDNPAQQANTDTLRTITIKRLDVLQQLIDTIKQNKVVNTGSMKMGNAYMLQAKDIVTKMQDEEQHLLLSRTAAMAKFSNLTPIIIVIAAIIAIIITLLFYKKVNDDLTEKTYLTNKLQKKDEEITERINIIQNIAEKISKGDYTIRVNENEKDSLGSLSGSLNKMTQSLEYSFRLLSDKEWLQAGLAQMNEKMMGEKDIPTLTQNVIDFICEYTNSHVGALYLTESRTSLMLKSSYAFAHDASRQHIQLGAGIIGQCALSGKEILLENMADENFTISFGAGEVKPANVLAFPILFEKNVAGVIEVGSLHPFTQLQLEFLKNVSENIGVTINTSLNRTKLQELLEETQAQSEELQAQHSELENLNSELEAQSEELQTSEEELKVQQEELMQTNQELEERSRLLEEKNHLVVMRNLEIQKKSEELALNAKYKSEFLANMSHELRTPLNSILLLSRLLSENSDKSLSNDQVEYAKVIQSSGNGLLQLIDEILDLSKIESGKMQLEYEPIFIDEIVTDIQSLFGPLAKEKKLAFNIEINAESPVQIETDKMRLEQIIKNLISNALKFTNKGFINLNITPSKVHAGFIDFSVKDSGIGIPLEKQQLIFEAFQQADGSTRRKFGGTGLGLSISRQLAILLGGDIELNSEPDKGSEFILSIPQSKNSALKEEEVVPYFIENKLDTNPVKPLQDEAGNNLLSLVIPEEIPDDRNNINENDKVILIVEDDTSFAKALLDFTRNKGYKGIVAVRGDHGIELAKVYRPKGILLDIQLPIKSGWEVMNELKNNTLTRHIPVHIMSSFQVRKESLMKGAVDFINKPVLFEQMDDIIEKIEFVLSKNSKKVLIVEENAKHAKALSYFLSTKEVNSEISNTIDESIASLRKNEIDCVILDMGVPDMKAYETLDAVNKNGDLENVPIIIFTGKSLSKAEETRIKKYADSIVIKTAHSYQRILDEVSLFLHLVEENKQRKKNASGLEKLGALSEVLKDKTVLITDDDIRNIFSLTKALEKHKMNVISALDGKEALEALQKNSNINIVLMDMMMPQMDGYETIGIIRKNHSYKNLPVIAVTAKAMMGDREKCIQAGASDYISKPVDIDQLISLLRIWLYENDTK